MNISIKKQPMTEKLFFRNSETKVQALYKMKVQGC